MVPVWIDPKSTLHRGMLYGTGYQRSINQTPFCSTPVRDQQPQDQRGFERLRVPDRFGFARGYSLLSIDLGDDTDNSRLTKPRSAHSSGYTSPATSNTSSPILQRRLLGETRTRSNGEMTNTAPRSSSEDIAFISKIVNNVLDGVGIPWYQNKRLATVMQDENIRLLVANRILSGTTTKRQHRDVIQHEQISPDVFKGLASLLKHAVKGIDQVGDGANTSGIGSIFTLLEVAYTRHMGAYVEINKTTDQKKKKTSSVSSTSESPAVNEIKQILNGCEDLNNRPVSSQAAASTSSEKLGSPRDPDWSPPSPATLTTPQPTLTPSVCPPTPDTETEATQFQYPSTDKQTTLQRSPNPPGTPESGSPPTEESSSIMNLATSLLASGTMPPDTDIHRKYLYEEILGKVRSSVWEKEDTWEGMFYDAVHTEREILGMNRYPHEMQDRYTKHSKRGRQRIETDEDELLYGCIKNIVGFMVALEVETKTIMKLISRLEGKTHIGLKFNPRLRLIKEHLPHLTKNQLTLKPLRSQLPRTSYLVHQGTTLSGETLLLEISAEAIFIRSPSNMTIKDRYFLEDVRRVSFSKKYKIMSLWVLTGAQQSPVTQIQFCSQKSAEAYNKIKESFKRIKKTDSTVSKKDSSAEFEVQVFNNTEVTVYLEITQDYVKLKFPTETNLIPVSQIFRVTRNKDSISLDALVANGQVKPYVFKTSQGSSICDRILTSFERMSLHKPKKHLRPGSRDSSVTSDEESSICLSSPEYQFMSSDDEEGI
ncbi:MAP kinase-activating death domain protein-like isoform X1 [Bolinopsis microptera]|uniref:MAP kinase-activating death domain protein-like isoform X1 n=2 Tax=Bolinopsis microptera TaxID=2820187 RepID=UPI003079F927